MLHGLVRVSSSSSVYAIDAFVHRTMSIIVRPSVCPSVYRIDIPFFLIISPFLSPSYCLFFCFWLLASRLPRGRWYFCAFMKEAAASSLFCSLFVAEVFVSRQEGGSPQDLDIRSLLFPFLLTNAEFLSLLSISCTLLSELVSQTFVSPSLPLSLSSLSLSSRVSYKRGREKKRERVRIDAGRKREDSFFF